MLGLDIRSELSPAVERKVIYSGTNSASFKQASRDLDEIGEFNIGSKRVERAVHRVGGILVEQHVQAVSDYQHLPLVEKERCPVANPPDLAVVMVDGGRYQRRDVADADDHDDAAADEFALDEPSAARKAKSHWREDKAGLLMTMSSEVHSGDPHPEIPAVFLHRPSVEKLAREIGHWSGSACTEPSSASPTDEEAVALADHLAEPDPKYQPPKPLVRTYVATAERVDWFEKLLLFKARARGFFGAKRRAFVADGAAMNWTLWQRRFRTFEPILDFIHALSYVFAGAMAGRNQAEGISVFRRWVTWVWQGNVAAVIVELAQRQSELGTPTTNEAAQSPRSQVARSLGYLQKHQSRMAYNRYRQMGLPITSCHIESTIKMFNKRIKGTEKFWTAEGAEAVLQLRAAYLGELGEIAQFWENRHGQSQFSNTATLAA